jgi:hypothetical protein
MAAARSDVIELSYSLGAVASSHANDRTAIEGEPAAKVDPLEGSSRVSPKQLAEFVSGRDVRRTREAQARLAR